MKDLSGKVDKYSSIPSTIELGLISPAEEYCICIQNDDLNEVILINISERDVLTTDINKKAKSTKKLEFE